MNVEKLQVPEILVRDTQQSEALNKVFKLGTS